MTCAQFDSLQAHIRALLDGPPLAHVLVSNGIYHRMEHISTVAIFDTPEQLEAYYEASRLPEPVRTDEDGRHMSRLFRPDSLLWDFNGGAHTYDRAGRPVTVHAIPADPLTLYGCPRNPTPPSGPVPPIANQVAQ